MDSTLCLSWHDHHEILCGVFQELFQNGSLVDCTIAADGRYLKAHKLVLSACSPYFKILFLEEREKNPIVVLKDVKFHELKGIVEFAYTGKVTVPQEDLQKFVAVAESLQIKGLASKSSKRRGETAFGQDLNASSLHSPKLTTVSLQSLTDVPKKNVEQNFESCNRPSFSGSKANVDAASSSDLGHSLPEIDTCNTAFGIDDIQEIEVEEPAHSVPMQGVQMEKEVNEVAGAAVHAGDQSAFAILRQELLKGCNLQRAATTESLLKVAGITAGVQPENGQASPAIAATNKTKQATEVVTCSSGSTATKDSPGINQHLPTENCSGNPPPKPIAPLLFHLLFPNGSGNSASIISSQKKTCPQLAEHNVLGMTPQGLGEATSNASPRFNVSFVPVEGSSNTKENFPAGLPAKERLSERVIKDLSEARSANTLVDKAKETASLSPATTTLSANNQSNASGKASAPAASGDWPCLMCSKVCDRSTSLINHMRSHLKKRVKPLKCSFCNKRFQILTAVLKHEASHNAKGLFKCPSCDKVFKTQPKHERNCSDNEILCDVCGNEFTTTQSIQRNSEVHKQKIEKKSLQDNAVISTDSLEHEGLRNSESVMRSKVKKKEKGTPPEVNQVNPIIISGSALVEPNITNNGSDVGSNDCLIIEDPSECSISVTNNDSDAGNNDCLIIEDSSKSSINNQKPSTKKVKHARGASLVTNNASVQSSSSNPLVKLPVKSKMQQSKSVISTATPPSSDGNSLRMPVKSPLLGVSPGKTIQHKSRKRSTNSVSGKKNIRSRDRSDYSKIIKNPAQKIPLDRGNSRKRGADQRISVATSHRVKQSTCEGVSSNDCLIVKPPSDKRAKLVAPTYITVDSAADVSMTLNDDLSIIDPAEDPLQDPLQDPLADSPHDISLACNSDGMNEFSPFSVLNPSQDPLGDT